MAVKKEPVAPAPVVSDKKKALETAMQQIEKMYGKGSIMRYGAESTLNVESIPTGSLSLDLALGIGGLPRGRIVEIYGPESSGKTTLALHVLAEAQKMGGELSFGKSFFITIKRPDGNVVFFCDLFTEMKPLCVVQPGLKKR